MNEQNVKEAIKMMRQIEADPHLLFDMTAWQTESSQAESSQAESLEDVRACGMACCFGGYMAIYPYFSDLGFTVGVDGEPLFKGFSCAEAVSHALEIPIDSAKKLTLTNESIDSVIYDNLTDRPARSCEIQPGQVIEALECILEHECIPVGVKFLLAIKN